MAQTSPMTLAINSIAQCLAAASEAARELDLALSQDLRSLLHLASCEADRVRKASRRRSQAASAKQAKKQPAAKVRNARSLAAAPQRKSRKAATVNGAAH